MTRGTPLLDRRSVLRGIGALGVGSAVVGTGVANPGRGRGNGADELPIGSQLFTYFLSDFTVSELVYLHGDAGFDIFEPFFIDDPDAIETAMAETGVDMPTAHAGGSTHFTTIPSNVDNDDRGRGAPEGLPRLRHRRRPQPSRTGR